MCLRKCWTFWCFFWFLKIFFGHFHITFWLSHLQNKLEMHKRESKNFFNIKIKECETQMLFWTTLQRYKQLLANQRFIIIKLIASKLFLFSTTLFMQPLVILILAPQQRYFNDFFVYLKSSISPYYFSKGNSFVWFIVNKALRLIKIDSFNV